MAKNKPTPKDKNDIKIEREIKKEPGQPSFNDVLLKTIVDKKPIKRVSA